MFNTSLDLKYIAQEFKKWYLQKFENSLSIYEMWKNVEQEFTFS